jgi:hypothetical protein
MRQERASARFMPLRVPNIKPLKPFRPLNAIEAA